MTSNQPEDGVFRYVIDGPCAGDNLTAVVFGLLLWYQTWLISLTVTAGVLLVGYLDGDLRSFVVGWATFMLIDGIIPND
jgi:hypothetical protein